MSENTTPTSLCLRLVHHSVDPLPDPTETQRRVLELATDTSVVVRGAPGSGRTTTALLVFRQAVLAGQSVQLWVPDRVRADVLTRQVSALSPQTVRAVRTPLAWAFAIVNTWRTNRPDPLGPMELMTGAAEDAELEQVLSSAEAPWPSSLGEHMRGMAAFRMEVRNLFARCGEAGIDAEGLRALGERCQRPEWVAAASVLDGLQSVPSHAPSFRGTMVAGISTVQTAAATLLGRWNQDLNAGVISADAPAPDLIIIDDIQDMNAATLTLVEALAALGTRVVAFADPDVAISAYRGGDAHLDGVLEETLSASHVELGDVFRGGPRLRALTQALSQTVPSNGPIARRKAGAYAGQDVEVEEGQESIGIHLAASMHQLGAVIARDIRSQHVHQGLSYGQQAVVVRSQSDKEFFQRCLERAGIPVHHSSSVHMFSAEPVARILLQLLVPPQGLVEEEGIPSSIAEQSVATDLLQSVLVGIDALDIRRLHESLGHHDVDAARLLNNPDAVAEALSQGDPPQVASDFADNFQRATRMWQARNAVHQSAQMGVQEALWKIWDSAQVAEAWRAAAIAPTPLRALGGTGDNSWFDQQLDSVMALFRVADVWEQRNPRGTVGQFATQLLEENVASDTLATPGLRPGGVWVVTPAQALGRSWETVWVAGVQDGHWPNVRLRDRALRPDLVIPAVRGEQLDQSASDIRVSRRATEHDEMRLLIAAVTRSRGRLRVGAVSNEDQAPSVFMTRIRPFADDAAVMPHRARDASDMGGDTTACDLPPLLLEQVRPPLDLDGQAGTLRHIAAAGLLPSASDQQKQLQPVAAAVIAVLALEGVRSAQPTTWCGAGGVTSTSAVTQSGPVRISSSSLDVAECPLRWFLEQRAGARPLIAGATSMGTLIHSIAQEFPFGTLAELQGAFEERFGELELEPGSIEEQKAFKKGHTLVEGLADYLSEVHTTPAEMEIPFSVELGETLLRGRIDRLEHVDGGVRITDFKTGSTTLSEEKAKINPQLAAYQISQAEQGHTVVGARLVYLQTTTKASFAQRSQPALNQDEQVEWKQKLSEKAARLRGPSYQACPSGQQSEPCKTCGFKRICPAYDSAQRTIE